MSCPSFAAPLTPDQLRNFRDSGYLLLPGLLDAPSCDAYNRRFEQLVRDEGERPEGMIVMRDVMVAKGAVRPRTPLHAINKILNFGADPVLWRYACDRRLRRIAEQLLGEPAGARLHVISSNVFNKPPGVDGRHPMHQDLRYFRLRPADGIVAAWTALAPCSRLSGCLAVLPGSHRGALRDHGDPDWEYVNHAFYGIDDVNLDARVHLEMQPGDTLFFHPLLIHGSGSNRSDFCRRAISAHYASPRCQTPEADWKAGRHVHTVA